MKKYKWGIIGAGNYALRRVIPFLQNRENQQVYAISKRNKELARKYAEELLIPKSYSEYQELLAQEEIDRVWICSSNEAHFKHAEAALLASKDVVLEKPLCISIDEAKKIGELVENSGVKFVVGYNCRFSPSVIYAKEIIKNIGEIKSYHASFSMPLKYPIKDKKTSYPSWYYEQKGGGALYNIGAHVIDNLIFLSGGILKETNWKLIHANFQKDQTGIFDEQANLTLTNEGATAQISCSIDSSYHSFINILGTKGSLLLNQAFAPRLEQSLVITKERGSEIIFFPENNLQTRFIESVCNYLDSEGEIGQLASYQDALIVQKLICDAKNF